MSSIVLSASVRQNLLSLQSTADLLSTTQNRLATGKKVNSALDNPTNFFTAAALDSRASDINNLLDGIGNGVQALQAANTGISSLQKLVDSAKSIASQVLQTAVGYSSKSSTTSAAITGATATSILGSGGGYTDAIKQGGAESGATGTITASSGLAGGANSLLLGNIDSFTVNTKLISFNNGLGTTGSATAGTLSIDVTTGTVQDILSAIDAITGTAVPSTIDGSGYFVLHTGTASDLTLVDSGASTLAQLGLTAGTTARGSGTGLSGKTLTVASTGGGTATSITFGTGGGQVSTLDQLNTALAANNLQASINASGQITLTTTNDAASATIGTIGGTAAASGQAFNGLSISSPVADAASQAVRANLVSQYNNILKQIDTTSQDSSYNGVNLLNGDTLKLTFNETGKSTLSITGATFGSVGLGLSSLSAANFADTNGANSVIAKLNSATTTLRSQASTLGSNLSVVQIRQSFSKSLINVLQTGSSNLTLADTNEEAANSQALSTRQSIAVSALALANQSQQSVLQLLR